MDSRAQRAKSTPDHRRAVLAGPTCGVAAAAAAGTLANGGLSHARLAEGV